MDKELVVRQYQLFFYGAMSVRLMINDGDISMVRQNYYHLEGAKWEFDRAFYGWKCVRDWMCSDLWTAADGWELFRLSAWVQKEMLQVQEDFRLFIKAHQAEAFPASGMNRTVSPYELMLYNYLRFDILPGEKKLACAAD